MRRKAACKKMTSSPCSAWLASRLGWSTCQPPRASGRSGRSHCEISEDFSTAHGLCHSTKGLSYSTFWPVRARTALVKAFRTARGSAKGRKAHLPADQRREDNVPEVAAALREGLDYAALGRRAPLGDQPAERRPDHALGGALEHPHRVQQPRGGRRRAGGEQRLDAMGRPRRSRCTALRSVATHRDFLQLIKCKAEPGEVQRRFHRPGLGTPYPRIPAGRRPRWPGGRSGRRRARRRACSRRIRRKTH
jgi:hypothetical protein